MSLDNYSKLKLCLNESNKLLRNIFLNRWKELFQNVWKDTKADALFFEQNEKGRQIKNSFQIKKFQVLIETGNSKEWDISILVTVLLSKPFLVKKNKVHIEKIREIRNKLAHLPDLALSDEMFENLFASLSHSIEALDCEESTLNSLKSKLIDQNQRVKKNYNEDLEFKNLVASAEKEFFQKNYIEALKLYSTLINSYELSNEEYSDLYYKRSLTNMFIYNESDEKNEKQLYRSLWDAEKAIDYGPNIAKGYAQAAELHFKLNELDQAEEFYKKALAIDCGNKDLKNLLAKVRSKLGIQSRLEHLDIKHLPLTAEESNELFFKKLIENQGISNVNFNYDKMKELALEIDPTKADVFLGHEYRDGSKSNKQNYEMAAKFYGKAALNKSAEALYNLALLHMKGLGVIMDYNIAIGLLKQAASQPDKILFGSMNIPNVGVKEAEHSLGLAYEQGTYVEKNIAIAVYWYNLAVKHENGYSANNLGLLYQQGNGVEQNFDKAEELFLFAHKLGNDHAVTNLVGLYLLKNDPEHAHLWHKRALENNCMIALSTNDVIMEKIESMRKMKKIFENQKEISQEKSEMMQELIRLNNLGFEKKITPFHASNEITKYDSDMLENYASNKHSVIAAKMLKAQSLFFQSILMLATGDYEKNIEQLIELMSEARQIESLVCSMPIHLIDKAIEVLENFIKTNKNKVLDCQARICLMYLNTSIEFITSSLLLHPKTKIMLELRGCLYCFEKKWSEALKDFEEILKFDPMCYDNLYHKSAALYQMNKSNESYESFKKFLSIAPKDHRKIPKAYYTISIMHLKNDKDKSKEFYHKGLQSEMDQLPCFLPFTSTEKDQLAFFFEMKNKLENKLLQSSKNKNDYTVTPNFKNELHIREIIAKDYRRVALILEHREYHHGIKANGYNIFNTAIPPKKQALQTVVGLKPIYLRDIDFTKDHILKNCVLSLKSIEIPTINISTSFVSVDDHNIAERVAIYNLKEDASKIEEIYQIGCRFSIINPYIRMAQDGIFKIFFA